MLAKLNIRFLSCVLASIMMLTSCSDFLDRYPSESIEAGQSISSLQDAQVALRGALREMSDVSYYGRRMVMYGDMKGGDLLVPSGGRGDDVLWSFNHDAASGTADLYWNIAYKVILQANNIITNIDAGKVDVSTDEEQKTLNDIKGQALFIRAICHFDLVKIFGYPYAKDNGTSLGVPIALEPLTSSEKPSRSTVAKVYDQIITDLEDAIGLLKLPKKDGFINGYAAMSLLARVYLYKGDWDNAYTQAKSVIESGEYTPYSNADWVASWSAQFASESIFELIMTPTQNDLGSSSLYSFLCPKYIYSSATAGAVAGTDFIENCLAEDPNDVRWGVMDIDEYDKKPGASRIPDRRGWIKKYYGDGKSTTSATNVKVIRLSEVYLTGAEAALKKSSPDLDKAVEWLNEIRKRSPSLSAATTADTDLEEKILTERRKELIAEGHRYFDQLRLGRTVTFDESLLGEPVLPPSGRGLTVDWDYVKCIFPIPQKEINANPAIKDQQNPGY